MTVNATICVLSLAAWVLLIAFHIETDFAHYHEKFQSFMLFPRVDGLSFGPNSFALSIHAAVIWSVAAWIKECENKKSSTFKVNRFMLVSLVLLSADVLSTSRLMIGTFFSLAILLSSLKKSNLAWRLTLLKQACRITVIFLLPTIIILTIWVVMPLQWTNQGIFWNTAWTPYFHQNYAAIGMFLKHPLIGIGLGNFKHQIKYFLSPQHMDMLRIYESPETLVILEPHCTYTAWAAETGLVGLLALVFFAAIFIRKLKFIPHATKKLEEGLILKSILAGFVLQGFFNSLLFDRSFWLVLGIAAGFLRNISGRTFSTKNSGGSVLPFGGPNVPPACRPLVLH